MSVTRGRVDSGASGGGVSGTIGAAVPASASPAGVQDASGNLAYPKLDGSGNLLVAVTGAGSGGTSSADEATYTPTTTAGTPAMAAVDDTSTDACAEDKVGILRMTAQRGLHVNNRTNAGVELFQQQLDFDSGAGTATTTIVGIALPASGGPVAGGTNTNPIQIGDAGGSLTVDNTGTFAVQAACTVAAGATNIAKAEDVASADADVGVPAMAVRKATPANTSGADGDYEMLQMSAGRLWTSATIDTALPAGSNAIGKLAANSGVDIGDIDVTSIVPGSGATNLGKAEDAAHADGDVGVMALSVRKNTAAATSGADGDYQPLISDTNGRLHATLSEFAAHDAAVAGNPVVAGARATTALSGLTLVADGDATRAHAGVDGVLIVRKHCNLEDIVSGVDTDTAGDSSTVISAPGAGVKIYVCWAIVKNTHASTDAYVDLKDGSTVKASLPAPAAGGGMYTFDPPLAWTANTAVSVDPSAAVTTIITTVGGFKSKI